MAQAPRCDRFPADPSSWYLFCSTRELFAGPVSKNILGRRLVAFRTEGGRVAVMDGRCSHLGADLGRGRVVGDSIQCPFHHWEYAADGRCTRIPTTTSVPAFAQQKCYPAQERHGFLFFFNGREPLFPLPFFFDESPGEFVAGKPFRFVGDCTWYMLAANGFDSGHFQAVHDRTLLGPPEVDCPTPHARRMRFISRVTGQSIFDRLLSWFAGPVVQVSITSWGGPFILVTGFFRRARSYILIATQPITDGRTLIETIVFARRGQRALQPLSLWLRRVFTRAFLHDDLNRLGGIRYNPHTLLESDQLLIEYFLWAAALPHHADDRKQDARAS